MGELVSLLTMGLMCLLFTLLPTTTMWPAYRSSTIHFPAEPARLPIKNDKDSDETSYVCLRTLLETRCQSLFIPFKPLWWLFKYVSTLALRVERTKFVT